MAGDVLTYFGDLTNIFNLLQTHLSPGGYFIFSVEIKNCKNFQLQTTGRFCHDCDYIAQLAQQNNLKIIIKQRVTLRHQANQAVSGQIYMLQLR